MIGRLLPLLAATVALAAWPAAAAGQEREPLVTDRPDQTESAVSVAPGFVQIELGGLHEVGGGADERLTGVGAALARIGVIERVELRLGFVGWQRVEAMGSSSSGLGDLSAGMKLSLADGDGLVPAVAILGTVLVPVGDRSFRAAGADPAIRAALAHDLGGGFALGYNFGAAWVSVSDAGRGERTVTEGLYTLAVSRGFGRLGLFLEGFGLAALSDGARAWHAIDGGATYALSPSVQVDASVGAGLTGAASDWFVGLGLSFRVPR